MTPREAARRFCAMSPAERLSLYGKVLDLFGLMKLTRALKRKPASTYQRCLAVHLHFSAPRGGMSE